MNKHVALSSFNKNSSNDQRAKYLARIIKSRRLKQQRTLEELSYGICSTSYLSKIENCCVDVEEVYYRSLLEKVNIDYDNISFNFELKHLRKVLNHLIHMSYEGIVDVASKIDNTEIFHEVECEIILLLLHTFEDNTNKCEDCIRRLESLVNTMLEDEYVIFSIVHAFYLYKISRLKESLAIITEIQKRVIIDNEIQLAIDHLLSMIYFSSGNYLLSYKYSEYVQANLALFPGTKRALVNQIYNRILYLDELIINDIGEYRSNDLKDAPSALQEYHQFHIGYALYKQECYLTTYDILRTGQLSGRIMSLFCLIHDKLLLEQTKSHIRDIVTTFQFSSNKTLYYHFVQANIMKWNRCSNADILNYLKDEFFSKLPIQYEHWLVMHTLNYFVEIGNKSGKYKECCKILLEYQF